MKKLSDLEHSVHRVKLRSYLVVKRQVYSRARYAVIFTDA